MDHSILLTPLPDHKMNHSINPSMEQALSMQWSVIPCHANKKPFFAWKIYQEIRPDSEQLRAWKKLTPSCWGVITGEISGLIVIDFDGPEGIETMHRLGIDPHVLTGSGGYHVYFKHPGFRVPTLNRKSDQDMGKRFPGLDVKGDGGYAIFTGRNQKGIYQWLREPHLENFNPLPADFVEFLKSRSQDSKVKVGC